VREAVAFRAANMKPRTILVVDDNHDAANVLAALIRAKGHHALVAYDTATGFELAVQSNPDVIIHDIGLPLTDGYVAAERFRSHPNFKDTLLVALTGYTQAADRRRAMRSGFDLHVSKPMEIEQLDQILNGTAAERRAQSDSVDDVC
jgi:CheY-like chemotaxis protein